MTSSDPHDAAETRSSRQDAPTPPEGTQGTVTLDELFFLLSDGALGTRPRAYDETFAPHGTTPQQQQKQDKQRNRLKVTKAGTKPTS